MAIKQRTTTQPRIEPRYDLCSYCAEPKANKAFTSKYNPKSYIWVHDRQKCIDGIKQMMPGLYEVRV